MSCGVHFCRDTLHKHEQQRKRAVHKHSGKAVASDAATAAAAAPASRKISYEEQYVAVMGGSLPARSYDSGWDKFVEVTPSEGQLHAFPVLPAGVEASTASTANVKGCGASSAKLKDARDKEDWSFAKVIRTSGYFPELGNTVPATAGGSGGPVVGAWGKAASKPAAPPPPAPVPIAAKEPLRSGMTLFATGSSRKYK